MPAIILGCIKFGWATPTEAAVFAAVYALFVGLFIYRELKFSQIYGVFLMAAKTTAAVMLLVAAALISAWLITQANIPAELGSLLEPLKDNPTVLLLVMMVIVVIVGTALDFAPTVLILTPILMPLVKEAGINPVYFGVLFIMNNAIGLITPPVGIVLNVVAGVAKLPMGAVIRGVTPFLLAQTFVLFLLVFLPQWVLAPLNWLRDRVTFAEMLRAMVGL
jgi:tripartite ATP-independent transporter DctM subunit